MIDSCDESYYALSTIEENPRICYDIKLSFTYNDKIPSSYVDFILT
jgi:hypothetical protein